MRSSWPFFGVVLGGVGLALAFLIGPASCSSREPLIGLPPLGQKFTLMPVAVNDDAPIKAAGLDYQAVRLNVMWGGRPIRSGATLRFYEQRGGEPTLSLAWESLAKAHEAAACTSDLMAVAEPSVEGTALVCDGSLKIESFLAIDAIDAKGDVRRATSWATYPISDDVLGVSIQLY